MISYSLIGYAFMGGLLPACVWLYFLLKEDERCPEPRPLILIAFLSGALAVAFALPFEHLSKVLLQSDLAVIVTWATIEEVLKYALVSLTVLWRRAVDESVDLVIYMITAALGFAALENVLFFFQALTTVGLWGSEGAIATGNLRFVGSTLLHIIASAAIGFALAYGFRAHRAVRALYAVAGLILAIALHAAFNFLIISGDGSHTLFAFFVVWIGAVIFFAAFEVLKYFRYRNLPRNTC
jgi:RsiW-degrading membrane proteinase PrsW (M82 family)